MVLRGIVGRDGIMDIPVKAHHCCHGLRAACSRLNITDYKQPVTAGHCAARGLRSRSSVGDGMCPCYSKLNSRKTSYSLPLL